VVALTSASPNQEEENRQELITKQQQVIPGILLVSVCPNQ